jgi:hypothetical protein
MPPPHIAWLKRTPEILSSADGKQIEVWQFSCDLKDDKTWSLWAKHFREHYCLDSMIDALKAGTPYAASRAEYLKSLIFPDAETAPGPSIRAGDFAEIIVADLLEYHFEFWVPRTRYKQKAVRNESVKGTDIIGMRFTKQDGAATSTDTLITVEAKAQFSGKAPTPRLQHAVNDSAKDAKRKAETLNALKRRFIEENRPLDAARVQRFQDALGAPYVEQSGAAAVLCNSVYNAKYVATSTSCASHNNVSGLRLIVIRADTFMKLVNLLYARAANEA